MVAMMGAAFAAKATTPGIYLACPLNYFGLMGYSDKWQLATEDNMVYKGTFTIPAERLDFYIVEVFEGDTQKIYGSKAREGGRVQIKFEEIDGLYISEQTYAGEGDWAFEDWPGGELSFEINFMDVPPTVVVSTMVNPYGEENGVAPVAEENRRVKAYNLQGLPVDPSARSKGIYIVNGKKYNNFFY